MKKLYVFGLIIAAMLMLQSCMVSHHPNRAFFDNSYYDYKGAEFTRVNVPMFIAKPFMKKALKNDGESREAINLIKKIKKIRMLTVENGNKKMVDDLENNLKNDRYEEWMTLKSDDQNINIRVKQTDDIIKKMFFTIKSDNDLVFIKISGKINPNDLSKVLNDYQNKK